ncbi:MAG: hypothetical protein AB1742_02425 [bacterium]
MEALRVMDGTGGRDYLIRSIAIVTLLYERGILDELLESGRLSVEEIEDRVGTLKDMYPGFMGSPAGGESGDGR